MSGRSSSIKVSDDAELLRYMRERLDYDPTTGALTRKAGFTGVLPGQRVGTLDGAGKRQAAFLGKRYQAAHLVWLWETGELPRARLSKKNGDPLDDRFENLTTDPPAQEIDREALRKAFLAKARKKFGAALDLSGVAYVTAEARVSITCLTHGPFERTPESLLGSTHGCPTCCREHAAAPLKKAPAEKLATRRAYVEANRELYRAAVKRSHEKRKSEDPQAWQARLDQIREWKSTDKGKASGRAARQRRRARLKDARSPGVTAQQWAAICLRHTLNGAVHCAYCKRTCGSMPTVEHVAPLARGGRDEPGNVVPACRSCNSSKGALLISEWPRAALLLSPQEIAAFSNNAHLRVVDPCISA